MHRVLILRPIDPNIVSALLQSGRGSPNPVPMNVPVPQVAQPTFANSEDRDSRLIYRPPSRSSTSSSRKSDMPSRTPLGSSATLRRKSSSSVPDITIQPPVSHMLASKALGFLQAVELIAWYLRFVVSSFFTDATAHACSVYGRIPLTRNCCTNASACRSSTTPSNAIRR